MGWPEGHPERGDYAGVLQAIAVLSRAAEWLGDANNALLASGRQSAAAWEGEAANAFLGATSRTAAIAESNADVATSAAKVLQDVAGEIQGRIIPEAKRLQAAKADARAGLAVAEERLAQARVANSVAAELGAEARQVAAHVEAIEDAEIGLRQLGEQRRDEAGSAARRLTALAFQPMPRFGAEAPAGFAQAGFAAFGGPMAIPSWWGDTDLASQTPDRIRAQWDELTDAQRQALIESDPLLYGNLDGIPLGWRTKANEINIRNEIKRLEDTIDSLEDSKLPVDHATDFLLGWMGGSGIQHEMDGLRKQIDAYEEMLRPETFKEDDPSTWRTIDLGPDGKYSAYDPDDGWPQGSQVILFDPANKRIGTYHGTFTEAGDIPPEYENVVTYTPGTGTQPWKWDGPDARGSQLFVEANRQGGSTAMIVWSDGLQPQEADAITPGYAQKMGPKLVDFTDAYIPKESTYTAMAHSYGATTLAQAEVAGLDADRVLYVAPAGYGQASDGHMVKGLEDFPKTGDKPHYVMISRNDPIVGLIQGDEWYDFGIHGDSPTNDPDVTRLETGWFDRDDHSLGYLDERRGSHSTPFHYETTAHQNMVEVITGGTAEGWNGPSVFDPPGTKAGIPQRSDERDWPDVQIE